jgi:UDP-N-acetyl-D-glucosamine dehydrogenase
VGLAPSRARILVLGVAYKRDVGDWRESPALPVIEGLQRMGAHVEYHDPHVPRIEHKGERLQSVPLAPADFDLVIITTDHRGVDYASVVADANAVLDTRNATKGLADPHGKVTRL